jgi:hypothetical protein
LLQLVSVLLIVASAVIGFLRLEKLALLRRLNTEILFLGEERGSMLASLSAGQSVLNKETGDLWTPAQIKEQTNLNAKTLKTRTSN